MRLDQAINFDDLRRIARQRLPKIIFDFVEGGCDDDRCLERNREAFRKYALIPRYLVDITERDQSIELFGRRYASPFGISPMGLAGLARPGIDLMLAKAAANANVPYLMSSASNDSIEAAAKVAPSNTWFQMYATTDEQIDADLVRRSHDLGLETLVITVDVPLTPNRERNHRNGFGRPLKMTVPIFLESLLHPEWITRFLMNGGIPKMENWAPYAAPGASADVIAKLYGTMTPTSTMTWKKVDRIRALWPGNLVIKGILHPADAVRAVQAGAGGLIISNHGGRQLDAAPSPLEMLPAIKAAVGAGIELILESGVRRGSDIVIALALGARATFFGRPMLYGAVAGGQAGADKALAMMRREVDLVMGQIGCTSVSALNAEILMSVDGSTRAVP